MDPEAVVTMSPEHVASLGLQRMRLLSGTQEEVHGSSHTSKSRMGTRGCGRGCAPETENESWGVSLGPSSTPVPSARTRVLSSHSVDLDSHNGSLGCTAGTPPCLAFPWTALPSSSICISFYLTPPQLGAQLLQGFCLLCAHLWVPEALSPVPSSFWRRYIPTYHISTDLLLPWFTQHSLLGMPTTTTFLWLCLSGSKIL